MITVTSANYSAEIEQSKNPVLLDVYATWCGPCQHMMPSVEELEKEFASKYTFAKLNVDDARDLAIKLSVSSVPTFIFFKNGKIVGKETGYMSKESLKGKIEKLLG